MTALDDWIADLRGGKYSQNPQHLISPVDDAVAALLLIQAGLAPIGGTDPANTFFAGPVSGAAAAPAFRAIDPLDLSAAFGAGSLVSLVLAAASSLKFGTTAAFPALQRTGAALQAQLADGSGLANFILNQLQPSQTAGILGTTTNNNANAGSVGEFVQTVVTSGAPVSLASNTPKDLASTGTLGAGDWDVQAQAIFIPNASTTILTSTLGLNLAADTLPVQEFRAQIASSATGQIFGITCARQQFNLAAPAAVHAVASSFFGVSTMTVCGFINARRPR